jgi:6-phosphofructokinase 2
VAEKKLRCPNPKTEPGGGGVNVSRAIQNLGGTSSAMYLAGGFAGDHYTSLLNKAGIQTIVIPIQHETRENIVVVDESTNHQYRFTIEGPEVSEKEWKHCLEEVHKQQFDFLVASGSLAPGMPTSFYKELASIVNKKKAKLVIDTSGAALKDAVDEGVFLIKPNLGELSSLYCAEELHDDDATNAAKDIISKGYCEVIVVSMGASGALLVTKDEVHKVHSLPVKKKSTVGAGDSMVAGILMGITKKYNWKDVLRYGVAAGTAATMHSGTELCKKGDTERLFNKLSAQ